MAAPQLYTPDQERRPIHRQDIDVDAGLTSWAASAQAKARGLGAIGDALGSAGNKLAGALAQVQERDDVARAQEAETGYRRAVLDAQYGQDGFLNKNGLLDPAAERERLAEIRAKYRPEGRAGERYDRATEGAAFSAEAATVKHAYAARKTYYGETAKAKMTALVDTALTAYTDDGQIDTAIREGTDLIRARSQEQGMPPEKTEADIKAFTSLLTKEVIEARVQQDPASGLTYFEKHKSRLTGEHKIELEGKLQKVADAQQADEVVRQLFGTPGSGRATGSSLTTDFMEGGATSDTPQPKDDRSARGYRTMEGPADAPARTLFDPNLPDRIARADNPTLTRQYIIGLIESDLGKSKDPLGDRYKGLFQLGSAIFKDLKREYSTDPKDQAQAEADHYEKFKLPALRTLYGDKVPQQHIPIVAEYMLHQQGVYGGRSLLWYALNEPDMRAVEAVRRGGQSNPESAISGNLPSVAGMEDVRRSGVAVPQWLIDERKRLGDPSKWTAGEFVDFWHHWIKVKTGQSVAEPAGVIPPTLETGKREDANIVFAQTEADTRAARENDARASSPTATKTTETPQPAKTTETPELAKAIGEGRTARPPGPTDTVESAGLRSDGAYLKALAVDRRRAMQVQGLQAGFATNFARMARDMEAAGLGRLQINSAYRSPEYQADLVYNNMPRYGFSEQARRRWLADVERMGATAAGAQWRNALRASGMTKWIAPPGGSNHQRGLAIDIGYASAAQRRWVHANARAYGLHFRMGHEPWHIEPIDLRGNGTTVSADTTTPSYRTSQLSPAEVEQRLAGLPPRVADLARRQYYQQFAAQEQFEEQQRRTAQQQAWDAVRQGLSPDELPQDVQSAIGLSYHEQLRKYDENRIERNLGGGGEVKDNPVTRYKLNRQSALEREKFLKQNLLEYINELSPSTLKELEKKQIDMLEERARDDAKEFDYEKVVKFGESFLGAAGITVNGKSGDERQQAEAKIAQYNDALAELARKHFRRTKEMPTQDEMRAMVKQLLVPYDITEPGTIFGDMWRRTADDNAFGFQARTLRPGQEMQLDVEAVLESMPTEMRTIIERDLTEAGVKPTDERIAQHYVKLLGAEAEPDTIPPRVRMEITDALRRELGREPSIEEVVREYSAFVAARAGRSSED